MRTGQAKQASVSVCRVQPVAAPDADMSQHARSTAVAAAALRRFYEQPAAHQVRRLLHTVVSMDCCMSCRHVLYGASSLHESSCSEQDFRELKARGYKPGWYPDAVHTDSGAALWLDANGGLARWQQVGCHQFKCARLHWPAFLPLGCAPHPFRQASMTCRCKNMQSGVTGLFCLLVVSRSGGHDICRTGGTHRRRPRGGRSGRRPTTGSASCSAPTSTSTTAPPKSGALCAEPNGLFAVLFTVHSWCISAKFRHFDISRRCA
jgi:hypothetical protein